MASYVVMEPPEETGPSDRALFIRDGFHFFAFLVPVVWFALHRAWLPAIGALALAITLSTAGSAFSMPGTAAAIGFLLSIWFGLESGNLRIASLAARGWRQVAVIEADTVDEAEVRYLAGPAVADAGKLPATPVPGPSARKGADDATALGLFGYPGRR